jgi:dephospho-coA kinase
METPYRIATIGITGGIGSGKSIVSRILRLNGFSVYDCDFEARRIMENSAEIRSSLLERWGEETVGPDGSLCRPHIASKAFANPVELKWLDRLVHSAVRRDFVAWRERRGSVYGTVFVESALLKKSGLYHDCDRIWLVDAPRRLRIERVRLRSGLTDSQIEERMESQKNEFDFSDIGTPVDTIANDGRTSLLARLAELQG